MYFYQPISYSNIIGCPLTRMVAKMASMDFGGRPYYMNRPIIIY